VDSGCKLGVLAFGDSITNGGGELQWGVALQSWALWVARATGIPYTGYAFDGARVQDVLADQIPAFERQNANPGAFYDLGCLYIGVNDVRALDWDRAEFEAGFATALEFVAERCERTLTVTAPLDLGRPRAGAKVQELNDVVRRAGARQGVLVLELADFKGRTVMMADHIHPTAFGQIAIAERAVAVLAGDGMAVRGSPRSMISYETSRWGRLRGDATYAYRHLKVSSRSLSLRLRAGRLPPSRP
jgi:lysophospholipase L1-like esterase